MNRVIRIEAEAPPKPAWGEPCNGCGVCCLSEPCPVGIVLSRRLRGPCIALRWDEPGGRYRCNVFRPVGAEASLAGPADWLRRARESIAGRWIGAGTGCDCSLEVTAPRATEGVCSSDSADGQ